MRGMKMKMPLSVSAAAPCAPAPFAKIELAAPFSGGASAVEKE